MSTPFVPPEWMIPDLDFAILDILPVEGSLAGYVPVAISAKGVQHQLGVESGLSVGNVSGRLRELCRYGFARKITTLVKENGDQVWSNKGRANAYQATQLGLSQLRVWKAMTAHVVVVPPHDEEGEDEQADV